jgi:DNA-3-methyladenine glycosylase II
MGARGRKGQAVPVLMQDHPGWSRATDGMVVRVMRSRSTPWLLTSRVDDVGEVRAVPVGMPDGPAPTVDRVDPESIAELAAPLGAALAGLGLVVRVRNADLWDAIGYSIIRQVIRAGQARLMYERFCSTHGEPVSTPYGERYLFPSAANVLDLPDEAFVRLGMKFKASPLRAAASGIIRFGGTWQNLDPEQLAEALQSMPRIGPWTAGATVADVSGDFANYPYDDLAVRTWARKAAPALDWPDDTTAFGALWRHRAGEHLSALTLLTLAWGGSRAHAP